MRSLLFFIFSAAALPAWAAAPDWTISEYPRRWLLNEGTYSVGADTTYSYTQDFFDTNGNIVSISNASNGLLGDLHKVTAKAHAGFGVAPSLAIFGQLSGVYTNITRTDLAQSIGLAPIKDRFGGGDGFLAARYSLWSDQKVLSILELAWLFPLYGEPDLNELALGDKSNDFTIMYRGAFHFDNRTVASIGVGFTKRSNNYADEIPYNVRLDFRVPSSRQWRFFVEWLGYFSLKNDSLDTANLSAGLNTVNSLSFQVRNPDNGKLGAGVGWQLNKNWELAGAFHRSLVGKNSYLENLFTLAINYRLPNPQTNLEPFSKEENLEILREPVEISERLTPKKRKIKYGFSAQVEQVSSRGNFAKIAAGSDDGVQVGDTYHIFSGGERPIAETRVVAVRAKEAFLRVEARRDGERQMDINSEARQVIPDQE